MTISDVFEAQAKLTRSIEGPANRYLEMQEQMRRLAEGPLARYEAQQEQIQAIFDGPGKRYREMQKQIQRAMEGPLASFLVERARVEDATAPLRANDDRLRELAEALAAVESSSEPEVSFSPLTAWLFIAVRLPSVARLRLASELIGIALAVAAFAEVSAGADVDDSTEWVQAALGLLIGLAGYLLRFVDDDS